MATYEIRAAHTQEDVLSGQCDVVQDYPETLKEAKARAKYFLSDEYQRACEMSRPLGYAQVIRNGECVADFFRDEDSEPAEPVDDGSCDPLYGQRMDSADMGEN